MKSDDGTRHKRQRKKARAATGKSETDAIKLTAGKAAAGAAEDSPVDLARKTKTRKPHVRFLIVCEGARTEPNYFQAFPVNAKVVGTGHNTVGLVREAERLAGMDPYEHVWCVFDRDSFPLKNYNEAIALAGKLGYDVAYSNEAFELWYLLHFHYYDSALSRDQYEEKLSRDLKRKYKKNDRSMYDELLHLQPAAIKNARKLMSTCPTKQPWNRNPVTAVYKLVEHLNKNKRN